VRHERYRQTVLSTVRSLETARLLDRGTTTGPWATPASVAEAAAAFVTDTAVFGATGPILGARQRYEIASTVGTLSSFRVTLDHRRYLMPVKPYTVAARLVHVGQYGPDAADARLLPTFLGSRQFVHGYGWSALRCGPAAQGDCAAFEELLGTRLVAASLEVRAPLMGILAREIRYASVPVDAFVFADSGVVWPASTPFGSAARDRRIVSSVGGGVRVNAFGLPFEFAAVRALDAPAHGWSFDFSLRPAF
jgi:outer membrane protein assembly factor BamA